MINMLRDGSTVKDKRLDRIQEFDIRSRNYSIAKPERKKYRSYTWRCTTCLDQGKEGSCVGHGIAHELLARPVEVKNITHTYAKENIYWEAQRKDQWKGGSYPGANPVYEGTSVLSGVKVAQSLGWFEEYRWAFSFEELILGVGYNSPAVLGLKWYEGMGNTDKKGYITPTGKCVGGHCILCNAVDIKNERLTLHNSWGKNWGINGECYITFLDIIELLKNDGEAVFFIKHHNLT